MGSTREPDTFVCVSLPRFVGVKLFLVAEFHIPSHPLPFRTYHSLLSSSSSISVSPQIFLVFLFFLSSTSFPIFFFNIIFFSFLFSTLFFQLIFFSVSSFPTFFLLSFFCPTFLSTFSLSNFFFSTFLLFSIFFLFSTFYFFQLFFTFFNFIFYFQLLFFQLSSLTSKICLSSFPTSGPPNFRSSQLPVFPTFFLIVLDLNFFYLSFFLPLYSHFHPLPFNDFFPFFLVFLILKPSFLIIVLHFV